MAKEEDAGTKAARQEAAEMKKSKQTEKAYMGSMTTTEAAPLPKRPASGVDKGEFGKSWMDLFK